MVVCTAAPLIRMAAACPITPAVTIHPYSATGLCTIRTLPQRYTAPQMLPPLSPGSPPPGSEVPLILVPVVYGTKQPPLCQSPSCGGVLQCCPIMPPPPATLEMCPVPQVMPPEYPLQPNLCSVTAAPSWKQSYGMEQVWQNEFKNLFSNYSPHNWMLLPIIQKPMGIWNSNVDSAKVRFCCEDCGHGWTSMKGRVAFWFVLNPSNGEGMVCLKLYGQQCDRCKTGNYEPAMWYPEEVLKVLVNIYNRVGQVYYGFQQAPYHRVRRAGKPRTPHNSDLCQACKDGVCAERR